MSIQKPSFFNPCSRTWASGTKFNGPFLIYSKYLNIPANIQGIAAGYSMGENYPSTLPTLLANVLQRNPRPFV
jgi:hypothetical protein